MFISYTGNLWLVQTILYNIKVLAHTNHKLQKKWNLTLMTLRKRTNLPTKDKPKVLVYTKSPLKEDNLSTKDKMAGPEGVRGSTIIPFSYDQCDDTETRYT